MSLYDSNELNLRDLEIFNCNSCGHTQIPAFIDKDYYQDYSMGSFWGDSFKRIREHQLERLSTFAPSSNSFWILAVVYTIT